MNKYIWEVGIDIQTVYLYPEADCADDAILRAESDFYQQVSTWEGFNLDFSASSAEVHEVTTEYAKLISSENDPTAYYDDGGEKYSDKEVIKYLMDLAGVKDITQLKSKIKRIK